MRARPTLQDQIETRITAKLDSVFLTREFADLSGERQVLRSLRKLVDEGKLMRLGYGVYARAEISPLTQQPMLAARNGFVGASREALTKLGIAWEPTEWETAAPRKFQSMRWCASSAVASRVGSPIATAPSSSNGNA